MRETSLQREIIVPNDMRGSHAPTKSAPRRATRPAVGTMVPGDFVAVLRAGGSWLTDRCLNRPGETAGFIVAFGAAIYISVNALGFQEGRHPAPILPHAKAQVAEANAAKPAARPIPLPTREEAQPPAPRDSIAEAIRSAEETTASVSPKPDRAVIRAQRALTKLGFGPLKDDGVMGPSTKAAIERFERERKLPVKGEASGKTLRELSARAGLPPD